MVGHNSAFLLSFAKADCNSRSSRVLALQRITTTAPLTAAQHTRGVSRTLAESQNNTDQHVRGAVGVPVSNPMESASKMQAQDKSLAYWSDGSGGVWGDRCTGSDHFVGVQ